MNADISEDTRGRGAGRTAENVASGRNGPGSTADCGEVGRRRTEIFGDDGGRFDSGRGANEQKAGSESAA